MEHDPLEIWRNVQICLSRALASVKHDVSIVGIGITNQRETTIVWNKHTGAPYHRAIVWNDTRTNKIISRLEQKYGTKDIFRKKTGLPLASYFSASKLMFLLETIPEIRKDAEAGTALFGTIDSWIIWRLTNGKVHATDVTNASRTLMMNLQTLQWDEEILQELKIPVQMLPSIHPSAYHYGLVDVSKQRKLDEEKARQEDVALMGKYHGIPITGVLGDQHAALFGQGCYEKGQAKCTYGTGAFLLMNTGNQIVHSSRGLLTTLSYQLSGPKLDNKPVYALEGSVAYSGSLIQWLRDNLQIIGAANETEALASSVLDNGGVYFVPAFAGLYAPYWREDARAVITGLTAFNTKAHIVRAALEASAFQTMEVIEAMNLDSSRAMKSLKVDGGLTANELVMQFQSDMLRIPLVKPKIPETTCLGAAFIAGLGSGLWQHISDIENVWHAEKEWRPKMPEQQQASYVST